MRQVLLLDLTGVGLHMYTTIPVQPLTTSFTAIVVTEAGTTNCVKPVDWKQLPPIEVRVEGNSMSVRAVQPLKA